LKYDLLKKFEDLGKIASQVQVLLTQMMHAVNPIRFVVLPLKTSDE
jgi:hypothetical protein